MQCHQNAEDYWSHRRWTFAPNSLFQSLFQAYLCLDDASSSTNLITWLNGYIDVGDGCWRQNLLATTLRSWWRFCPCSSPTSMSPSRSACHRHLCSQKFWPLLSIILRFQGSLAHHNELMSLTYGLEVSWWWQVISDQILPFFQIQ